MSLPEYFEFQSRTKIIFGNNTLQEVGTQAKAIALAKGEVNAFLVCDPVIKQLGYLKIIEKSLNDNDINVVGVFDEIPPNSDIEIVTKASEIARQAKTNLIITMGGGSTMDSAKGMNILLVEGGDLIEDHQGTYLLQHPLLPMVAIPTTAGTGSECTFAAVIKDNLQKLKITYVSPYLAPNVAILDPVVTQSCPANLTAATGMDALTHAVESIHSTQNEPISDALALHSITLIMDNLVKAVKDGNDLSARGYMLIASNIAGLAFSNALVGAVHAMAHACGGLCDVPHGVANGILLPYVMEYNLEFCAKRYALVAKAMGINIENLSAIDAGKKAIEKVKNLLTEINFPKKLSEVGVTEDKLQKLAEDAMSDGCVYNNPREATEEEILEVFKKAY